MKLLKRERLPLAVTLFSWGGITCLLFETAHIAFFLAFLLSALPSLSLLFLIRSALLLRFETENRRVSPVATSFENMRLPPPITESSPDFRHFLNEFSDMLAAQKLFLQEHAATVKSENIMPAFSGGEHFTTEWQIYSRSQKSFALWQEYKQSVLAILGRAQKGEAENSREIHVEKLRYQLAEREFLAFHPQDVIKDAVEEVRFFLQAIKRREKELADLVAYLDKVSADGIWLSAEKRKKIKDYEQGRDTCQKQLQKDAEEVLSNLEEISSAL